MLVQFFINITNILRDLIISPTKLFTTLQSNRYVKEIYFLFIISAIITFAKTSLVERHEITFFQSDTINEVLSFLNIPQVRWLILYLSFFIFLGGVYLMCKLFNRKTNLRILTLSLMSISGLGVVLQISIYFVSNILSDRILHFVSYLSYFWTICLSLLAIKYSQAISSWKATICFLIPALPFIILVMLSSIAPYLAWLYVY